MRFFWWPKIRTSYGKSSSLHHQSYPYPPVVSFGQGLLAVVGTEMIAKPPATLMPHPATKPMSPTSPFSPSQSPNPATVASSQSPCVGHRDNASRHERHHQPPSCHDHDHRHHQQHLHLRKCASILANITPPPSMNIIIALATIAGVIMFALIFLSSSLSSPSSSTSSSSRSSPYHRHGH